MKVVSAAVKVKIPSARFLEVEAMRHADCYEILNKNYPDYDRESAIEGFIVDTRGFVDRYEAKRIAVAANQLIVPIEETCAELYSEDVW